MELTQCPQAVGGEWFLSKKMQLLSLCHVGIAYSYLKNLLKDIHEVQSFCRMLYACVCASTHL